MWCAFTRRANWEQCSIVERPPHVSLRMLWERSFPHDIFAVPQGVPKRYFSCITISYLTRQSAQAKEREKERERSSADADAHARLISMPRTPFSGSAGAAGTANAQGQDDNGEVCTTNACTPCDSLGRIYESNTSKYKRGFTPTYAVTVPRVVPAIASKAKPGYRANESEPLTLDLLMARQAYVQPIEQFQRGHTVIFGMDQGS